MEFRILGSFEVLGTAGPVDLRGAKRRGLFACLLVHAGQPLSPDRLVEELWADGGSVRTTRTVQTYVSQLRKLLAGEPVSLVTAPGGYVLEIDPAALDAHRFEQAVTATGREPEAEHRLGALDGALALWRGPALSEFAGAGWADREAARLEALHLQALQRRCDALLDLDRAAEATAELEPLVRLHPLDERLWATLMLALYRSGRQADALGAYQHARRQLIDELGIEPGAALADLEHRILDHDPTLASTRRRERAGSPPASDRDQPEGWSPRTFLLTDIVESVSLWEHNPAAMSQAVARHDRLIEEAIAGSGGELVRTKGEGDSTFSVFLHPSDALAAAASIQHAVADDAWPTVTRLQVRAGVHTGHAEQRAGDWYGPAVNRAARLRAVAEGGQTLVSGVSAGLAADHLPKPVRLLYLGRRALRGIERPEEVWELVAADDPRLTPAASARASALPVPLTRLVGRTSDLETLVELMRAQRLVTLTGPGGSGKTRLALELARQAAIRGEAVWLAELAPLQDGELVAETVANAVGVTAGQDAIQDLLAHPELLAGVLVLDNCEHLLGACTALAERSLAAAHELRVLATSREPLGLSGERVWPVTPLAVPHGSVRDVDELVGVESVDLLLDRAREVRPDLELGHDDAVSVVQICRQLDGVPLAIELAAGRLRSLSLADLAARLGDQLTLLARHRSAGRDGARHQTLGMTLDWSYDMLSDQERTLAQRLSVFAGGFRLDAIEAVCGGDDIDVINGIDELVAKSLVTFDGASARYRLLEPIRRYLAGRLDESGQAEQTRRAHAEWVMRLSERLRARWRDDERANRLRLAEEAGNVERALRWAHDHDPAMATRIVGALGFYWFFYDQASGRRWCDAVIGLCPRTSSRSRAGALLSAAVIAQNDHAWDRSIALLREALEIYRSEGSAADQATSLYWLGRALTNLPDAEHGGFHAAEAMACFREGMQQCVQLGDSLGVGSFRIWFAAEAFESEDLAGAEQLANQVIEECGPAGDHYPVGQALCILAFIARRRSRDDEALELLREAVALNRELDDPYQLSGLLVDLAEQEAVMGQGAEALEALAESAQLDEQIGRLPGRSRRLGVAAVVHLARGHVKMSVAALGAYDAHPPEDDRGPRTRVGGSVGWRADAVETTRGRLPTADVAATAAAARGKSLDTLIDDLIIRPATATT
jgi:predicted ATPase/DNA-binding SARP family transcriptional activator